jgi:hypothetical protein
MEQSDNLDHRWTQLRVMLKESFGKKPDLNAILFLIGIQELGRGISNFTKEEKQDLMHIATCKVFSLSGFYELTHIDEEGWPHYQSVKPLPFLNLKEQDRLLRWHVVEYFDHLDEF